MKKFLALMIGLIFVIALQAQTSGTTYVLYPAGTTAKTAFNYAHTGSYSAAQLKDTIGGTAVKYWIFDIAKSNLYYFQTVVVFDTVLYRPSGKAMRTVGNHVGVWLYGSIDKVYWSPIDSLTFHPTINSLPGGANGLVQAVQMKDLSTGVLWRYFKVEATGVDAGKASIISKLMIKVGLKY